MSHRSDLETAAARRRGRAGAIPNPWMGTALAIVLLLGLAPGGGAADEGPTADTGAKVQPGAVLDSGDVEAIAPLIPEALHPYTIDGFGELGMEVVETEAYPLHPKFVEATVKFACQATLGPDRQLRDYTAGQPFPHSDWAVEATAHACDLDLTAPDAGLKLAWNANHRWVGGGIVMPHQSQSFWREAGDTTWKYSHSHYRRTYFSHRADLLPGTTLLLPDTEVEWAEYTEMVAPFDLRGFTILAFRYRDSRARPDDAWSYVPSLRRVRRISAEEKADALVGSDFTLEDFYLFSGYVWDQEWTYRGESQMLVPIDTTRACFPRNLPSWDGEIGDLGDESHQRSCRFGPYDVLPFVDERWQRRTVFSLEQVPNRSDHPYSRKLLWFDKETYAPIAFLAFDRDGAPFRTTWYLHDWSETDGRPETQGHHAPLAVASAVVNVQQGTSNLLLTFGTDGDDMSADEARRLFDITRLKRKAR